VLLSVDELKAVTGFDGVFTLAPLGDLPDGPTYASLHFKAKGRPESFDAAVRVYRLEPAAAEKRYQALLHELPAAEGRDELGDRSLRTREGDILGAAVLDRAHGVLLLFTCGSGLCDDGDRVVALLRRMHARIGRLGRAPDPAAPSTENAR
jgi:hypothetical protein